MTEQKAENQETYETETEDKDTNRSSDQDRDSERSSGRTRRPSSESKQTTRKQGTTRKRSASSSSSSSDRSSATKRRSQESRSEASSQPEESSQRSSKSKLPAGKAIVAAVEQLRYLTTREPESVVGALPHDDGWRVTVEVLESQRIPDTADIMAEYDVDIDGDGELVGYERKGRYFRGQTQRSEDGR